MFPSRHKRRKVKVKEALEILFQEEISAMMDQEDLQKEAINLAQESGIIFLDEIDKIASSYVGKTGPDVSREGVQRDLLPLVEGTTVMTKHGMVKTDHILFFAAGAFNVSKPSDLIPELQGRFPVRVEFEKLGEKDFQRILTEPQNALTRQYQALMKVDNVDVIFTEGAIAKIANYAAEANDSQENIGARRLHTIMEHLMDEIAFEAPANYTGKYEISEETVEKAIGPLMKNRDLARFIL
jgi:ATP-dependent HslUV protease ATP-binding subunit HslU